MSDDRIDTRVARELANKMESYCQEVMDTIASVINASGNTYDWCDRKKGEYMGLLGEVGRSTNGGVTALREYKEHLSRRISELES